MAHATPRSANADLHLGATEGTYKTVVRARGGVVDPATQEARADLNDTWYGIHEAPLKMSGDGVLARTPNFIATSPAHLV